MVKKSPKAASPGAWGKDPEPAPETQAGISTGEERVPPLDEGWEAGHPMASKIAPPDEEGRGPNPDYVPPVEEPAAKPKKTKKSKAEEVVPTASGTTTKDDNGGQLVSFVERMERLAEEASVVREDMKEVMAEAKGNGYDTATIRKVLARRKKGRDAVMEADAILDLYEQSVGWPD